MGAGLGAEDITSDDAGQGIYDPHWSLCNFLYFYNSCIVFICCTWAMSSWITQWLEPSRSSFGVVHVQSCLGSVKNVWHLKNKKERNVKHFMATK